MEIVQLSVGRPRGVRHRGEEILTGIFKSPVDGAVECGLENLAGDGQADPRFHGGRDKAVYAYPSEHYAAWAQELGVAVLEPSQFGENLTVAGALERDVTIGARYGTGEVEVKVMQPRLPCFKLGMRLGDRKFPKRFWESGRLGYYLRVEKTGILQRGDRFVLLDEPGHGITVHGLWAAVAGRNADASARAMELLPHLDGGWVKRLEAVAHREPAD